MQASVGERVAGHRERRGRFHRLWRWGWRKEGRPWWSYAAVATLAVLALGLYTWGLSRNGMGNSYYAAVVKSGTLSWKAFLFGSLDPGSFITVDKPPFAFWVQAVFARVFGFSSWSILLPQALAGVASVLILYRLVRRWAGEIAAVLAGLVLTLTPVAVVMFRFNNPDALLTFLFLLAAWLLWSALERGSSWKLAGVGALLGLGFTTKMLEAFVVLPAFAIVYLVCGRLSLARRLLHLLGAATALIAASSWWVAAVELWPKASRPFIGGTTNNSVFDLIFSRTGGYFTNGGGPGPGGGGPIPGGAGPSGLGPNFAGSPSWLRMFNAQLGDQISWLIPLALLCLLAGLWVSARKPRVDRYRAGFLLWGLWTIVFLVVFSGARGILHPYYTVVMAPSIAALVGGGCAALWRLGATRRWLAWLLPAGIACTALWSALLLGRSGSYTPGISIGIMAAGGIIGLFLALVLARLITARWLKYAAVAGATAVVLAGPFVYSISTISRSVTGSLVAAGPVATTLGTVLGGPGGQVVASSGTPPGVPPWAPPAVLGGGIPNGGVGIPEDEPTVDQALVSYLEKHKGAATYLVAVQGTYTAVPLILATGEPVMAMGGFTGSDPAPTLTQFEEMVAAGQIHYALISGGPGFGPLGGPGSGPRGRLGDPLSEVYRWVAKNGIAVSAGEYGGTAGGGTLYYLPEYLAGA